MGHLSRALINSHRCVSYLQTWTSAQLLNPVTKPCAALRGGVPTQMGVTGAHVNMATPTMEMKKPDVQVSSLHPHHLSDYLLTDESITAPFLTPLMAPLQFPTQQQIWCILEKLLVKVTQQHSYLLAVYLT